ncbi:MAG: hypothetical protein ACOCQ4_02335 [bacterium]
MKINILLLLMIATILLSLNFCDDRKYSNGNNFVFQGSYDSTNKTKVTKNIKETYIKNQKEKFENNSNIEKFEIFDIETEAIDTSEVLRSIKIIIDDQNFLLDNIIPDNNKSNSLKKVLKAHDDSLIIFYSNFHGYRLSYYYYFIFKNKDKKPEVYYHELWVDTNSNIVLKSMPYQLNILISEAHDQPVARHEQRKMFIKRWWSDTLPNDIDSNSIAKYYQEKDNLTSFSE